MENVLLDVQLELPSRRDSVQVAEKYVYDLKDLISISDEKFYNILITVTEAVNNGIMHGNKYDNDKKVVFIMQACNCEVCITIMDQGDGFDPNSLGDPREPENLFREHGRGVFLIKQLADSVVYSDCGRAVTVRFFL